MKIMFRYRGGLFLAALACAFFALLPSISQASTDYGYAYTDSKTGGTQFYWEPEDPDTRTSDDDFVYGPKGDNEYNSMDQNLYLLRFDRVTSDRDFGIEFYGRKYYGIYIGGNGYITFVNDTVTNVKYAGGGIPSESVPNALIAPLWGSYNTFD